MYIELSDISESMHEEALTTLQRKEENGLKAIKNAISTAESYLCNIYKINEEFNKTGESRNTLLVSKIIDIAIYNIYSIGAQMPEIRRLNYEDAIKFLTAVSLQKQTIAGLEKLAAPTTGGNYGISGGSLTPRNNHY